MKFAGIHKDKKGYIFTPLSKTIAGFLVSTEPVIRVYNSETAAEVATALRQVLDASKTHFPTPVFNNPTEDQKAKTKEKLKRLDIKSFNDLNKKPVLYCWVELHDHIIVIKPSAHDTNGKGYVNIANEEVVQVNLKVQDEEILYAIEEAFKRCK